MFTKGLGVMRHITLLLIRLVLGIVLIYHGWTRLKAVDGMGASVRELRQAGAPAPAFTAWFSVVVELLGGIFLIAGALTPFFAALAVGWMFIQIAWLAGARGLAATNGGWELPAALGCLALVLTSWGAGRISLDSMLRPRTPFDDVEDTLTDPEDFPARP